ncbi:GNAT family N-acetyltransferase [Nocardioides bruguierae]|uniref:GNAT family N-acetyltransferase n=1 Tax=Nocardioides bruguierae TaxID=2945102 RepID=A0A9X2D9F3_9ACTN|nr:GNAT family N-acetyltransferase [Nocardioides bruguierae]MCM0621590.1 GNAT family N-acetyltransferase [Nocardioides bruguierae]
MTATPLLLPRTMPVLEDAGVRLRPFTHADAPAVRAATQDPLIPLITTVPATDDDGEVAAYVERQLGRLDEGVGYSFAIADAATDTCVGEIGLWMRADGRCGTGYWVVPARRREGWASRALTLLTSWALDHDDVDVIELLAEPGNAASRATAARAGYQEVALLRRHEPVGEELRDMVLHRAGRGVATDPWTAEVAEADAALDQRLSDELDAHNAAATPGLAPARELTVRLTDDAGLLLAGTSGWTWGVAGGIALTWVAPQARGTGAGSRLLDLFETEARARGVQHVFTTSFTFQAPGFYQRNGYEEIGRWQGLPVAGEADVHLVKALS